MLEAFIQTFVDKGTATANVTFARHDQENNLRSGATKKRLPTVVARLGHKLAAGFEVGRLTCHYPGFQLTGDIDDDNGWSK